MSIVQTIWCALFHRKHHHSVCQGYPGWILYKCSKCDRTFWRQV
mgnify:CR=1 FL=1